MTEPLNADIHRKRIWGLNPNVFFLGIVSLLTDVSSEMIFTLIPLYLTNVLRAPGFIIGLVGGLSESTDAIFRIFSGWFSDKIGRRKLLAVLGYSISTELSPLCIWLLAGGRSYLSDSATGLVRAYVLRHAML